MNALEKRIAKIQFRLALNIAIIVFIVIVVIGYFL